MVIIQYILGIILPGVFALLGLIHVYWAFGGKLGINAALPSEDGNPIFRPTFTITMVVAMGFFAFAALVLGYKGRVILPIDPQFVRWGMLGIMGLFFARMVGDFKYMGIMKKVKGSPFAKWDDLLYTPLCGLIAVMMAVVLR